MKPVLFLALLALPLSSPAAPSIKIDILKNDLGQKLIESKVVFSIPEQNYFMHELNYQGVVSAESDHPACTQFLIAAQKRAFVAPAPLSPNCAIKFSGIHAFQCPGDKLTAEFVVDGTDCDSTIELLKNSPIQFQHDLLPEDSSDYILGVPFEMK